MAKAPILAGGERGRAKTSARPKRGNVFSCTAPGLSLTQGVILLFLNRITEETERVALCASASPPRERRSRDSAATAVRAARERDVELLNEGGVAGSWTRLKPDAIRADILPRVGRAEVFALPP
jgi:hypothetical protein